MVCLARKKWAEILYLKTVNQAAHFIRAASQSKGYGTLNSLAILTFDLSKAFKLSIAAKTFLSFISSSFRRISLDVSASSNLKALAQDRHFDFSR